MYSRKTTMKTEHRLHVNKAKKTEELQNIQDNIFPGHC